MVIVIVSMDTNKKAKLLAKTLKNDFPDAILVLFLFLEAGCPENEFVKHKLSNFFKVFFCHFCLQYADFVLLH